jgi:hypothetical protein
MGVSPQPSPFGKSSQSIGGYVALREESEIEKRDGDARKGELQPGFGVEIVARSGTAEYMPRIHKLLDAQSDVVRHSLFA